MYGDMSGFLDDNEEDTPVRWNPVPKPGTSRPVELPEFSHPPFKATTKTKEILRRKMDLEDNENSLFLNVPDEIIAKMASYLPYTALHNCRCVNSRFCRILENNWKNQDKPPLRHFVIERQRRKNIVNGFLHQKATYRALLTANDFEVFHVIAKKHEHCWWNYQIRKAGEGDKLADTTCPTMYRNVQSAPPVKDKVATLGRHIDFFWPRFKILDLVLTNVQFPEMRILMNAKRTSACTIHRLTLNFEYTDLTGDHVDLINTLRCHEVCMDFIFGGHIEPRVWFAGALRITETMLIRNLEGLYNITDNILLSWTAPKLHICGQTSVTVEGIKEFITEWVNGTRDIIFVLLQQEYKEVDWAVELEDFHPEKMEGTEDGRIIRSRDGKELHVTFSSLSLKLKKPSCDFIDLDPRFNYVGGRKL